MSTQLLTVEPNVTLKEVKAVFDQHRFHHLPVVRNKTLVGIISKTDLQHFTRGMKHTADDERESSRLENYVAEDIMTKGLAKLEANDRINVAIEVFRENLFHALPVMEDGELVGIITTFDIIRLLSDEDNQRIAALKT